MQAIRSLSSRSFSAPLFSSAFVLCAAACTMEDPSEFDELATSETTQSITVYNEAVREAGQIYSGGHTYRHSIYLANGGVCSFETTLGTMPDTVMRLRDSGLNQLAYDDDSGPGLGSQITMSLSPGQHYVDINGYSTLQTGNWTLTISCGSDAVFFYEDFHANGDAGQCTGWTGIQRAIMGTWTKGVTIDADGRPGWCEQRFGVVDQTGAVSGLNLQVNFYTSGDAGQCGNPGLRSIPRTTSFDPTWSTPKMDINTDTRGGGCWQEFQLDGRSDVALDIEFLATTNSGECGYTGMHTVTAGSLARIHIDTDNRNGGCTQRFRLRRL